MFGVVALVITVTAVRVRAARRRGDVLRRSSIAALTVAIALLVGALLSPLETLAASYLLTAHLVQVIVVMGFVPPLLLLGLPAGAEPWPGWLRSLGRVVVHPALAIVLTNAVFFGWHVPALYNACIHHRELYALQVASLLGVSLLFWWPIVEPRGTSARSMPPLLKLGFILLATIPQTFVGLLFALAHHVVYEDYGGGALGLSPLSDQQVAGACMALLSKLALFAAFSVVLWRLLSEGGADDDQASDDGWGRGEDDDAPAPVRPSTPAWLGLLERSRLVDEPTPVGDRDPAGVGAG